MHGWKKSSAFRAKKPRKNEIGRSNLRNKARPAATALFCVRLCSRLRRTASARRSTGDQPLCPGGVCHLARRSRCRITLNHACYHWLQFCRRCSRHVRRSNIQAAGTNRLADYSVDTVIHAGAGRRAHGGRDQSCSRRWHHLCAGVFPGHRAAASVIPAVFDDHSAQHSRQWGKSIPGTRQPGVWSIPKRRPRSRPSLRSVPGRRPGRSTSVWYNAQRHDHDS